MFFDVNSILSSDEYVIKKFTVSFRYRILMFLFQSSFLFLLVGATIGMSTIFTIIITVFSVLMLATYFFIYFIYIPIAILYIITNEKIVIKTGFFDNDTKSIEFERITDTHSYQSFWERFLFKSGYLEINTAGSDAFEEKLVDINNPSEISLLIQDLKTKTLNTDSHTI